MTTRTRALATTALLAVMLAVLLGGCGDEPSTTATDEPEGDTMSSTGPVPGAGTPAARASVTALATRLGIGEDEVVVRRVEEVTWSDGSLGCAEKGTMYTQALVDGHRIVLEVDGREYEFHDGRGRAPFLCEQPTE
jgi:hypothetical protein